MNDVSRYSTGLRNERGRLVKIFTTTAELAIPGAEVAPCEVNSLIPGPLVMTTGKKKITLNKPLNLNFKFKNMAMIREKMITIGTETNVSTTYPINNSINDGSVNKALV